MTRAQRDPDEITVTLRTWSDKRTGSTSPMILVRQGPLFIRIPISEAYNIVNRVHDLAEQHDRGGTP